MGSSSSAVNVDDAFIVVVVFIDDAGVPFFFSSSCGVRVVGSPIAHSVFGLTRSLVGMVSYLEPAFQRCHERRVWLPISDYGTGLGEERGGGHLKRWTRNSQNVVSMDDLD